MSPVRFAALLLTSSLLLAQKTTVVQKPVWRPSFTEDFETTELNLTRWTPRDPLRTVDSAYARPFVSDGRLHMAGPSAISTFGLFAQPYGRVEIRFRVSPDTRARFRLLPIPLAALPLTTVFEFSGAGDKIGFANFWGTRQTERTFSDTFPLYGTSTQFHTVTAVWERDRISWMLDGKAVLVSTEGVSTLPAFLLLDVTSGTLDIDYLRVWRSADQVE